MILGLPAEEVPHFYESGDTEDRDAQRARIKQFLDDIDLVEVTFAFPISSHEPILKTMESLNPGVPYVLGGMSRSGCGHSVVCLGGELHHDPTGTGIVAPMEDGHYWVTLFSPKPACFKVRDEKF